MISIIIPVFNAENYVRNNFYNLLKQKFNNFEVIYINDGSSDNTESILNELVERDSRFSFYTINNRGACAARIIGVRKSKFDYVTFLDIDDYLDEFFLEILYENILEKKADIVCCGFVLIKGKSEIKKLNIKPGFYLKESYLVELLRNSGWEMCAKLYKKSLFDGVELPNRKLLIGEDAFLFFQVVLSAKSILVVDYFLYYYNIHVGSTSHIKSLKTVEDGLYVAEYLSKKIEGIADRKDIDTMVLLFYSNSLRRGFLPRSNPYFQIVRESFSLGGLCGLPVKKIFFVFIMYIFNIFKS